ncbi:hypothetical protein DWZ56_11615 [Lachnotalea sp. AF33-28]|nr:hypothetical protein DWZ56_11615 [Lachnotalea sp. AF33-28]
MYGDYPEDREGILDIRVHLNYQRKIKFDLEYSSQFSIRNCYKRKDGRQLSQVILFYILIF